MLVHVVRCHVGEVLVVLLLYGELEELLHACGHGGELLVGLLHQDVRLLHQDVHMGAVLLALLHALPLQLLEAFVQGKVHAFDQHHRRAELLTVAHHLRVGVGTLTHSPTHVARTRARAHALTHINTDALAQAQTQTQTQT